MTWRDSCNSPEINSSRFYKRIITIPEEIVNFFGRISWANTFELMESVEEFLAYTTSGKIPGNMLVRISETISVKITPAKSCNNSWPNRWRMFWDLSLKFPRNPSRDFSRNYLDFSSFLQKYCTSFTSSYRFLHGFL